MRGAFVGSASGAVSIAAHALGGGAVSPGQSSIGLLIAACTVVGAVVGTRRARFGIAEIMVLLAIGQTLGHTALTMSAGHQHSAGTTSVMVAAHLAAVPIGALLIRGAEIGLARAISAVDRAVVVLSTEPVPPLVLQNACAAGFLATPRRLLLSSGCGLRGPPSR
ncbi:hypothetical protein DFR70_101451 [Nocardia tenerifensis]|uniref:Uncharacterized protein n=1 Tax=Nocardia tenerifensis TaxID=228006 RepID=A0A318KMU9_9NOCA|nr:hypothetical protein DFR70_101451 [Nocardia tenerifensis]